VKFGQLIIRKIIKIIATRCHILRLKCSKFDSGWGSAPDPAGGAYSAPRPSIAEFKDLTSKGREWRGREREIREGRRGGISARPLFLAFRRLCSRPNRAV